ncbi:unnamed protein product [Lasius platythorax]|uniref:G-protein coupled receptors family 2 profile 2 domain-containing protein n=1 Tax=Lasius platythorax TaxID=488582 RepID=A0AAV2P6G0_9HYME
MCGKSLTLWYCMLPLIASFSEHRSNSTSDEKEDNYSTVPYQLGVNTMRNYDDERDMRWYSLHENFTKDNGDMQYAYSINSTNNHREDEDLVQYKFRAHSSKNHENGSQIMPVESRTISTEAGIKKNFMLWEIHENLTRINDKNDSTSHDFFKNFNRDNDKNNIISHKMCENITCIRLCCPFGNRMVDGKCIAKQGKFIFLQNIYGYINDSLQNKSKRVDEEFLLIVHNPCQESNYYFDPRNTMFLANGSFYSPYYNTIVDSTSYCFAVTNLNRFIVYICPEIYEIMNKARNQNTTIILIKSTIFPITSTDAIVNVCGHLIVMLFALVMFIVYSILPELRNINGFILCRYSGLVFVGYTVELMTLLIISMDVMVYSICFASALVIYYSILGSYFWLNVMSFDMWRTFNQFRSLPTNVKQQQRRKLIRFSVYGWGSPFMLVIFYGIMDFVPGVPQNLRPGFGINYCTFSSSTAILLYYWMVIIISNISSIWLCICTGRKIAHYKKDIAHCLSDSESRRFNDNKQWFKLYLMMTKVLFVIICIKMYMYTIFVLYKEDAFSVWYTYVALDMIQHFCIFIIFVWKRKIKQLLLKRFGWQNCSMFSSNCITTSGMISLWERMNPYGKAATRRAKDSSESTDL